jgi:hypothetical protein
MTALKSFLTLFFCCVSTAFAHSPDTPAISSAAAITSATWDLGNQQWIKQSSSRYEELAIKFGANPTAANALSSDLARRFSRDRFTDSLANMIASNMTPTEIASLHKFVNSVAGQKYFAVALLSSTANEYRKKIMDVMSADELQSLMDFFSNAALERSLTELLTPTDSAGSGSAYERVFTSAVPDACKALASSLSVSDYSTLQVICGRWFVSPTSP